MIRATNPASSEAPHRKRRSDVDGQVVTSVADWLYAAWIALLIASTWAFLGAPILIALASLFTRLRHSRGKQTSIWVIASIITILSLLPLFAVWFGWSSIQVDEERFVVE